MKEKAPLIPLLDIDPLAREIAINWVTNYKPMGFDLQGKHKLASDIMNFAKRENASLQDIHNQQVYSYADPPCSFHFLLSLEKVAQNLMVCQ